MAVNKWQRIQHLMVHYAQVHEQQGVVGEQLRGELFAALFDGLQDIAQHFARQQSAGRNIHASAQEVLDRVWGRWRFTPLVQSYDPQRGASAYTYFTRVVRNAWLDWLRANRDKRPYDSSHSDEDLFNALVLEVDRHVADLPPADLTLTELAAQKAELYRQIASLSERQQAVLVAMEFEQMSQLECADRLGVSVSTIKREHTAALDALRRLMVPLEGQTAPHALLPSRQ